MSIQSRAARFALGAVCVGGGLLGASTALIPTTTAEATSKLACSAEITGSGSSLQKVAQESVFTADFASTLCSTAPKVKYTKTSSGPALEEFGNITGTLIATKSGNATVLDGYAASDDPPQPVEVNTAESAAGGGDQVELTIPVAEAPVALLLHPPSGCVVEATPDVTNTVLDKLWQDQYTSWDEFLTAAGVTHSGTCTTAPSLIVRKDNSGTSYVFKSYLAQIDSAVWNPYANDFTTWPDATTQPASTGGAAEASDVAGAAGTVGYAAAADAHGGGFAPWSNGASTFWGDIQNNGTGTSGVTYADPASGANGNCPQAVTPAGSPTAPGNWYGVLASSPNIAAATGFHSGQYSLCGLTYDLAWTDYAKIGGLGQVALYGGSAATATEVGNATADFLEYVTGPGQSALASAGQYYSSLPTTVQKVAQETAAEVGNPEGSNNTGGGQTTTTTTTTTTAAPTTTTTSAATTTTQQVTPAVTPPNVTASAASVVQGGHFTVTVSCPAGASTCAGAVSVKTASAIAATASKGKKSKRKIAPFVVGSQSFTLQGGQSKTLTLTLNSKAAGLLRTHGSLPVIATISVSGGHTVTEHVVLKAKVKKPAKGKKK
jgi:ABC-type phosphate transport system substrate-binding protein